MAKITYTPKKFSIKSEIIINQANDIIEEYQRKGFSLTLRQLYYQFVARDLIPNKQTEYKRLGSIISDARLAGKIDWYAIQDRTRNLKGNSHWSSPSQIIQSCASQFKYDLWKDQDNYVEVWIEKEALVGVISSICLQLDVNYFACRGYNSQTEAWNGGQRVRHQIAMGKKVTILHLGDHDPSGIDMTRDNDDRTKLFADDPIGQDVTIKRIALNMDQVEEYNPPPNPAKMTDSRFQGYIDEYGESCWELDALDPEVIQRLVEGEVDALRDYSKWNDAINRQQRARDLIQAVADNWEEIEETYAK